MADLRMQIRLGWTEAAMIAGARDVGVSPSIVGSFTSKEAALVEVKPLSLIRWNCHRDWGNLRHL